MLNTACAAVAAGWVFVIINIVYTWPGTLEHFWVGYLVNVCIAQYCIYFSVNNILFSKEKKEQDTKKKRGKIVEMLKL